MRPIDLQAIGGELAIKWEDGVESYISMERLRRACPCAACRGEADILGNVSTGAGPVTAPEAFRLIELRQVGGYGIQPRWADGHATGIFSFEYLRRLAAA